MMILEPFLAPLKKLGRAGAWGYGAAVLALSAAEEWFFRQFLLAGGVAVSAPTWLGFLGEGYVYAGAVLLLFTFRHPVFRGWPGGGLDNRPGRNGASARGVDRQRLAFVFRSRFHGDVFRGPGRVEQHPGARPRESMGDVSAPRSEGRAQLRATLAFHVAVRGPPRKKQRADSEHEKSRFDMERFLDTARRTVPQIADEEGRLVPARLIVMGGDWDASKGPPPDVHLVLDFGKTCGTDLGPVLMDFITDWLGRVEKNRR